ncbi:uncharacterized protein LOC136091874 [Hydra vulgaris]|uniref:Uncharacterized protein LOC136091874 n=1 Tax=Hydra vulgaris TaxID=6087 RepID=A0ABM4DM89_HYDVU
MDKKNIDVRKKSNETGNTDETQISTNVVRDIFHEMFSKQQKDIFKLICEITERVRILEKTNKDIEESLTVTQDTQEKKNVDIERVHRVGKKEENKPRTIFVKVLHYKDKIKVLHSFNRLKGSRIYINEDFSFETTVIRKKLLEEMMVHRKNGKYSSVKYDKLIVKEFRKNKASA